LRSSSQLATQLGRSRLLTGVAAGRELSEGQIFHQATGVSIFQASLDIQCKQVRFCQRLGPQGGCQLVNSRIANRAAELETRSALAPAFALGAVVIATIGQPSLSLNMLLGGAVFLAGVCVVGGQPAINALAASLYPTRLRATGVGWCLGIGRAGLSQALWSPRT